MSYFRGVINTTSTLHFGEAGIQALDALLLRKKPSKVFILVDGNTSQCLPFLAQSLAHLPEDFEILEKLKQTNKNIITIGNKTDLLLSLIHI